MPTVATLSLSLHPGTVKQALVWWQTIAHQQKWPPRVVHALTLSLDEALSNVLAHAFPSPALSRVAAIELWVHGDDESVILELQDNGIAFDPTLAQPPALATSVEAATMGGHGLRLMRHLLHDIQYKRADQKNCLRLIARLPAPAAPEPPTT